MTAQGSRLLILAPHVDDAEFGLGLMMQRRLALEQAAIRVLVIADGSYVRADGVEVFDHQRRAERDLALTYLGVNDVSSVGGFPENMGNLWRYGVLVSAIEKAVREFEATEVFTCLPSFNQDHRALFDATITAFRPGNLSANLYAYCYPGTCWGPAPPPYGKKYFVGLPNHVDRKIEALKMHKSQFEGRSIAIGPETALALARQHGAEIGVKYAELVYVLREIV